MPGTGEIVRSLHGAWRLARLDADGLAFLDASPGGFWRSFRAAGLVLPPYLTLLILRWSLGTVEASFFRYISVELIAYAIGWLLFPVVMLEVARHFDLWDRYRRYIVAYNWAMVIQNAIYLPILILNAAGFLSREASAAIALALITLLLVYTWFVTLAALEVPAGTATAITALDFVLGLILNATADSLLS
jgi:hypothetical protein